MSEALQRPALYYPYIHVRSEHWLKATLLCAPAVKRIVPEGYSPEDQPNIQKFTEISGPGGELLQSVPAYSPAADGAQQRLMHELEKNVAATRMAGMIIGGPPDFEAVMKSIADLEEKLNR